MSDPRMIQTPAPLIPPLEQPSGTGVIAEIFQRLRVVEQALGIAEKPKRPHEPLEGSDVRPMTDEA